MREPGSGSDRLVETMLARAALTALRPLPGAVTGAVTGAPFDLVIAALRRRHPHAFDRFAEMGDVEILIDPVDLPAAFRLRLGTQPRLRIASRSEAGGTDAVIRGAFAILLDLFEGRIDGDALFFSRDLIIEGDTEVVVGLRNAVDGEEFDLAGDLVAALGPLGRVLPAPRRGLTALGDLLTGLHGALLAPAHRRLETVERRLARLERERT